MNEQSFPNSAPKQSIHIFKVIPFGGGHRKRDLFRKGSHKIQEKDRQSYQALGRAYNGILDFDKYRIAFLYIDSPPSNVRESYSFGILVLNEIIPELSFFLPWFSDCITVCLQNSVLFGFRQLNSLIHDQTPENENCVFMNSLNEEIYILVPFLLKRCILRNVVILGV